MFSDSQASTATSELHGQAKEYVGSDFVVGGAGAMRLIVELFWFLEQMSKTGAVTGTNAHVMVKTFVEKRLFGGARGAIDIVLSRAGATPADKHEVMQFSPGALMEFSPATDFVCIGSGADFVSRSRRRDAAEGRSAPTLMDAIILSDGYMYEANESLTVDDQLVLSLVLPGRTYVTGHPNVEPTFVPEPIRALWPRAADKYREMGAILSTMRSEVGEAQRCMGPMRMGVLDARALAGLRTATLAIEDLRTQLTARLRSFFDWYDDTVGRPRLDPATPL